MRVEHTHHFAGKANSSVKLRLSGGSPTQVRNVNVLAPVQKKILENTERRRPGF
jgi:hypothetical protein